MSESALLTSVTLSSQVKNHILNLIAEQKLTPGMPVPSEIQLIQKLGVSRGIVREAYRSLAALGILETHSGKVPRIKKFDDEVLRVVFGFALATEQVTTEQILQVRRWLELGVVEAAARNGGEEDFANLRAEMAKIREQFDDVESFITHDIRFHQLLAVASKIRFYDVIAGITSAIAAIHPGGIKRPKRSERVWQSHHHTTPENLRRCVCQRCRNGDSSHEITLRQPGQCTDQ